MWQCKREQLIISKLYEETLSHGYVFYIEMHGRIEGENREFNEEPKKDKRQA